MQARNVALLGLKRYLMLEAVRSRGVASLRHVDVATRRTHMVCKGNISIEPQRVIFTIVATGRHVATGVGVRVVRIRAITHMRYLREWWVLPALGYGSASLADRRSK